MIRYPCVYTIQILPLSITRWITFITLPHGVKLSDDPTLGGFAAAHLFFRFVFRLSGFINVVLLVTTRPNILLFGSSRGVLPPGDPRAQAELQRQTEVQPQYERSDLYLPQFDGTRSGNPGSSQTRKDSEGIYTRDN